MKSFQYLNNPDKPKDKVLMHNLPFMQHPFIVRDENTNTYHMFDSYTEFATKREYLPKTLHEQSVGGKQKMKFDIDAKQTDIDTAQLTREEIISTIVESVANWLSTFADIDVPTALSKLVIADSSDAHKLSKHIVIDGYFMPNSEYAKAFYDWIIKGLDADIAQFVDHQVYKPIQSLRLTGCHKVGAAHRVKHIETKHTIEQSLFTVVDGCIELTTMGRSSKPAQQIDQPIDFDLDETLSMVSRYTEGLRFNRVINGNLLTFMRVTPSKCPICDEVHHKDNTLHAIVSATGDVIVRCKHDTQGRHIVAGCVTVNLPESAQGWSDQEYGTVPKFKFPGLPTRESLPTDFHLEIIDTPNLGNLCFSVPDKPDAECLIIKSGMGTGKTTSVVQYIKDIDHRIIYLSMRKTFTAKIKEDLKDFSVYSDIKGPINVDRLIIQYESLWRLDTSKLSNFTLIMDESESIIGQIEHAKDHANECLAKFNWLLRRSTKTIMMDATADYRTYELARIIGRPTKVVHNTHTTRDKIDHYYNEYTAFLERFALACKDAHRSPIVVAISSKKKAEVMAACAKAQNPGLRIALYTCEKTPEQARELADVNTHWINYDVVIYTPTITAGISFEKHHFHHQFNYFVNRSCDYMTAHQMTGRVRNISSNESHFFIIRPNTTDMMLPTTKSGVDSALYSNAEMILQTANIKSNNSIEMTIMDDGKTREYAQTFGFKVHSMNVLHKCQSVALFPKMFMRLRSEMGRIIKINRSGKNDKLAEADRLTRAKITEQRNESIANADVQDSDEPIESETLTKEQANGNIKIQLAADYKVEVKTITPQFVKQYNKPATKRAFRNVNTILGYGAKDMREVAQQRLLAAKEANEGSSDGQLRGYAARMTVALAIVEAITEKSLTTDIYSESIEINKDRLTSGLRSAAGSLVGQKDFIKLEFGIDLDQVLLLPCNQITQAVNRLTFDQFGLKFTAVRGAKNKTTDKVKLGLDKIFTIHTDPVNQEYKRVRPML